MEASTKEVRDSSNQQGSGAASHQGSKCQPVRSLCIIESPVAHISEPYHDHEGVVSTVNNRRAIQPLNPEMEIISEQPSQDLEGLAKAKGKAAVIAESAPLVEKKMWKRTTTKERRLNRKEQGIIISDIKSVGGVRHHPDRRSRLPPSNPPPRLRPTGLPLRI
ncbi:CDP-diacylglycerol-glycerol-3-phosphate3-phosphatidyltransferase [Striga asiatica]|uniref:CDP-diacylglycerol-glycerol-3-phosphate3-phosphatidyltransferase n=1 Tax=Striga asiatica TaxID=4170 RepID=A0A5A7Q8B0_STRAF|nr:CDP-diacylglycerol-glycerol-3-phosphate3-phosphatidyltransferase [Striga asiatica]